MTEPAINKPKGRKKLDSIISKLRSTKPAEEVVDSEEESSKPQTDDDKDNAESAGEGLDSGGELTVVKKSKRKSGKAVKHKRYFIDLEDDDDEVNSNPEEVPQVVEIPEDLENEEPMPSGNIADLLENGPEVIEELDDTTVLMVPAESIQVQAVAIDEDDFMDLSGPEDHDDAEEGEGKKKKKKKHKKKKTHDTDASVDEDDAHEEADEKKKKKKKEKKKKITDSDVSMDEDGLPKRVTCSACGRHINPSHGKILKHPLLNVLVCKKCNQYYNSGPFTRDEYGIEEQCRWCGDGGALICCDKCERAFCQPCIKRNCGKHYLKKLMTAPDDSKWNCYSCTNSDPIPEIKKLQKRCNYVMDILDGLKARKAPFKSKKGPPVSGPSTSERRNRLNSLSEGMGIKIEGLCSPEKSPTKKNFDKKDTEPPPNLFDDKSEEARTSKNADEKEKKEGEDEKEEGGSTHKKSSKSAKKLESSKGDGEASSEETSVEVPKKIMTREKQAGKLVEKSGAEDSADSSDTRRRSTRGKGTEKGGEENKSEEEVKEKVEVEKEGEEKEGEEKEGEEKEGEENKDEDSPISDEPLSNVLERVSEMSKHNDHDDIQENEEEDGEEKEEEKEEEEEEDNKEEEDEEMPRRSSRSKEVRGVKSGSSSENGTKKEAKASKGKGKKSGNKLDEGVEDRKRSKRLGKTNGKEEERESDSEEVLDEDKSQKKKSSKKVKSSEASDDDSEEKMIRRTRDKAKKQQETIHKKVKQEAKSEGEEEEEEEEESAGEPVPRRTTRGSNQNIKKENASSGDEKTKTKSSKTSKDKKNSKGSKKDVIVIDVESSSEEFEKSKTRKDLKNKRGKQVKKTVSSDSDDASESSDDHSRKSKHRKRSQKKGTKKRANSGSDDSDSSNEDNRISPLKVRFKGKALRSLRSSTDSSVSKSKNKSVNKTKTIKKEQRRSEESSESESDSASRKKGAKKKGTIKKEQSGSEESSESESDVASRKKGAKKKGVSSKKNKKATDSDDSEDDSEPAARRGKSRKKVVSQKNTRKRPRPASSSDSDESDTSSEESSEQSESSEESSDDKKKRTSRRKGRKVTSDESSDDKKKRTSRRKGRKVTSDESESDTPKKKKGKTQQNKKKTPKRRRTRANKAKSSDEESESESEESSDDSEADARPKRRGKKNVKKVTKREAKGKKGKGKRKRVRDLSDEEEPDTPSKKKGRRKIRKLLTDEKLNEETRKARRLEEERRQRLLQRTRDTSKEEMPVEDWRVASLVLESNPDTKEPIVEVNQHIVEYLKPHQVKGVQFMYDCTVESVKAYNKGEKGGGCLLAHCMGLGKTLQVVTLIHTLFNHKDLDITTALVVAPLNTLLNWQVEFEKWLSVDDRLEVYVLQEAGANNWRRADMLTQWQRYGGIMILGYDMYRNLSLCNNVRSKKQKTIFKEALVDPGPDIVICDEGHILRNDTTAISKALNGIKTRRRVVLTGTPLQNNLIEYHCMVSFVKPNLLGTRKEFMNTFGNPIQNGQCADSTPTDFRIMKQRCHVLFKMLEGCVQRRDYAVLTPFLPKKHEYVIKIRLCESQRKLYQHYLNTFVFPDGDVTKRGVGLFSDYQALMRIWTHPWCLKLEAIRRSLRAPYDDSDSLDDFVVHSDEDEDEESAASSSDEGGNSNVNSNKEEKKETKKEKKPRNDWEDSESSSQEEEEDESSADEVIPESRTTRTGRATRNSMQTTYASRKPKKEEDGEPGPSGVTANGEPGRDNNFLDLEEAAEHEQEWYDEFIKDEDEYNTELSGKLVLLLEILADAEAVEEKLLVFSQSLVSLDLIERALGGGEAGGDQENWCRGCDYFRMDGSTSVQLRQRWADIFNDEDNRTARLFLISTKAGGLGINLIAANRVIVFDASWNPSHDVQSIFRVYRFGQTRPVYVYRFLSQGTMEEKIYDRQIAKLSISQRVVDQHQIERHFTAADLSELYVFNPSVLDEEKNKDEIPSLPLPKDAILADVINRTHPKWIVKYHEHDSLLVNQESEELTEEEMKAAWLAYEAEKERANNPAAYMRTMTQEQTDLYERYKEQQRQIIHQQQQQQLQLQQQQQPHQPQEPPRLQHLGNVTLDSTLLQQIQRIQHQAERQRNFQSEMDRVRQERGRFLQGQTAQGTAQLRQLNQMYVQPTSGGQPSVHTEQMRQRLLQSMGASRPVHDAANTAGASYQPMMGYISQQQHQTQRLLNPGVLPAVRAPGVPQPLPTPNVQMNSVSPVVRPGSQ